ncbi:GNAT family N-acetyltransferase [Thalassobacillus hwangdonensis]|uniref:GNAT family N-acetyltransferase n=1 Tax=Thalassobacillus hwangdonensis TaxID=546108 RepID=A0ABW3L236_9BACI
MIVELEQTEFYKCKDLLNEQGQLEPKATMEGKNGDRIFVDDRSAPTSGFIWLGSDNGFIFIGHAENEAFNSELHDFFNTVIKVDTKNTSFEAIGNHSKWNSTFEEVFGENMKHYNQRVYELHKDDGRTLEEVQIEQGYVVVKITKHLLNDSAYENIEFLHSKILEFWTSLDDFISDGVGYSVIYENEIVSVCFSGVVAGSVHGIDIETLKAHQGKKLAQKVAHAFVEECLANGITPYWDCMEINRASVSVAENLGFKNTFNYVWYSIPFK